MRSGGITRSELREVLLESIERVRDGKLDAAQGRAIAELSKSLIAAEKLEFDVFIYTTQQKERELHSQPPLAIEHEAEETAGDDDEESEDDDEEEPDEPSEVEEPETKPKKSAAALPVDAQTELIEALLREDQPMELAEISRVTKIPQAECFQILKRSRFERTSEGFYWLVK